MKITILTDNTPSPSQPHLIAEHGLSILIEEQNYRIICDMGLGPAFYKNATSLDINLEQLDAAFVSHGHKDHSGGLTTFLDHNMTTPVYIAEKAFHQHFFTARHAEKRDISTDEAILENHRNRLHLINDSCWLNDYTAIVKCNTLHWPYPLGNVFLTAQEEGKEEKADDFSHELSLAFKTAKGLVIVSSCSHNGALNIVESCKNFTKEESVYAFVGGLHFVDCNRTAQEVDDFQKEWNRQYPDTLLYTGHCTSDKAKRELEKAIPHLHIFHTGEEIIL